MDVVERFAQKASEFEQWLLSDQDAGVDAARSCLVHLLELHRAGLDLESEPNNSFDAGLDMPRLSQQERSNAMEATQRLPFDLYGDVLDPTVVPADPSVGSLGDDIADIYADIAPALRAFERGDRDIACQEWRFSLHSHWGAHATSAARALHWWLHNNAPDAALGSPTG